METKQKYLRDIRDAINGVETAMPGVAGESEATYLRDIAKAIRSSGIDPSIPKVTDADNGKILKVINGVWAKGESSSGVLYGEETPASTLGKDGDVYVQYEIKENKTLKYSLDEPIVITDYSDRNQKEAGCIFTGITLENGKNYLLEASVDIVDPESYADQYGWTHVDGSSGVVTYGPGTAGRMSIKFTSVTPPDCAGARYIDDRGSLIAPAGSYAYGPHEGELAIDFTGYTQEINRLMYTRGSQEEYSRTITDVNAYEVEYESSLTDIYLKVNGEWIKDGFGGSDNDIITYETTITTTEHGWWVVEDEDGNVLGPDEYDLINVIVRIDNNAQGSWNAYGFMWFINKEPGDTDHKYLGSIIDINNWRRPDNPGTYAVQVSYRKKQN